MYPERILLGNGIYLNIIDYDKFKTNYISVNFLSNISAETVANQALLPFVLAQGTERLPNIQSIAKSLDMLYGSSIFPSVSKIGDTQIFGFFSYPLRIEYTDGNDISLEVLKIIGDMINNPYTENGLLSSSYTESEKKIMVDRIKSQINDKNYYSIMRCRQIMDSNSESSISEIGTEEQVSKVTAKPLPVASAV